eukprot:scaffold2213_cov444-Prasinococcus_capsulatus_cf.AAC.5
MAPPSLPPLASSTAPPLPLLAGSEDTCNWARSCLRSSLLRGSEADGRASAVVEQWLGCAATELAHDGGSLRVQHVHELRRQLGVVAQTAAQAPRRAGAVLLLFVRDPCLFEPHQHGSDGADREPACDSRALAAQLLDFWLRKLAALQMASWAVRRATWQGVARAVTSLACLFRLQLVTLDAAASEAAHAAGVSRARWADASGVELGAHTAYREDVLKALVVAELASSAQLGTPPCACGANIALRDHANGPDLTRSKRRPGRLAIVVEAAEAYCLPHRVAASIFDGRSSGGGGAGVRHAPAPPPGRSPGRGPPAARRGRGGAVARLGAALGKLTCGGAALALPAGPHAWAEAVLVPRRRCARCTAAPTAIRTGRCFPGGTSSTTW